MKLTLVNTASTPVPVMSQDEGTWVQTLDPDEPVEIDRPDTGDIVIGEKPGFLESIRKGFEDFITRVVSLINAWKNRGEDEGAEGIQDDKPILKTTITNNGQHDVHVILGNPNDYITLQPSESYNAESRGYIELLEIAEGT